MMGDQQSHDPTTFESQGEQKKENLDSTANLGFQKYKQSQSQKLVFEAKDNKKNTKEKKQRDHRKSYGLEFMDIRREIDREMKTLEIQKSSTLKKKQ